jgi:Flp pilus assembly pilin Flp
MPSMLGESRRERRLGLPGRLFVLVDESGQGLVEYSLILFLVSFVCITALTALGQSLSAYLGSISGQV